VTALFGLLKKELKIAFTTPIAYVVFMAFAVLSSLLFWLRLMAFEELMQRYLHFSDPELLDRLNFNDVILSYLFINMQIIFLVAMPMLTMRLIAEERKQKTFELLLTSPIRPWQILIAKYAASLMLVASLCVLALVYPAILHVFGQSGLVDTSPVDWTSTLFGLLGLFLAGAGFAAVGLFFSSVTENQVVAALLTLLGLLLLWYLQGAGFKTAGWLGVTLVYMSPLSHIDSFALGVLDTADLVYYLSLCFFFLFLTHRMIEGRRWT
jgi:ABC-2 type transport system permease protein